MKYFLCVFVIIFLPCCNNTSKAEYKKRNQLSEFKVIILGDPTFVGTTIINGRYESNVIISDTLIPDPEKRYYIAHLIRNILIKDAIIYNIDEDGNDFTMSPVVEIGDDFIYTNKDLICEVIYYLCHKDYFNLVGHPGGSGQKIFFSSLLHIINDDIEELRTKLEKEDALMLID